MSEALKPPGKKNPQLRTLLPTPPPGARSRRAFGFSAAAAEGRFVLQTCVDCGAMCYPARDACPQCLCTELSWRDAPDRGRLIAETTIRASTNTHFRERTPWRVGTVHLDCGLPVIAHLHKEVRIQDEVRLIARTDRSGQGVLMALPDGKVDHMEDDRQLRELTCNPKHRRILITDGRSALGQSLARAFSAAGAAIVHVGIAEDWRPFEGAADLETIPKVVRVALDVTDTVSVTELAGEIGGKVDILVNTADHVRPGGALDRRDVATARDEMETNYFGLLRLVQAFGPAMKARGADGDNSACAIVNILSVFALSNAPAFGSAQASHAAALALSHSLRAEMAGSGIKIVNALVGPAEEEWRQLTPPPKVTPAQVSMAIVNGLQQGLEELVVGAVAEDVYERWRRDPGALARELMQDGGAE